MVGQWDKAARREGPWKCLGAARIAPGGGIREIEKEV